MEQRINIKELEPTGYQAMLGLEKYLATTAIPPALKELIKIRASQINGCAYCIQMHTTEARKSGETEQRIYALSAWKESPLFSKEERAVLAMTEEITRISGKGLSSKTYEKVIGIFGENVTAQIILLIVTINSWNRIAVSTHQVHP